MSSELTSKPKSPAPVSPPLPVHVTPRGLEALKMFEKEIATYRRELPRLLEEKQAGRFALIQGDQLLALFDTWAAANEAGRDRFGLEPIFVAKINALDIERYALLDAWLASRCQS